jgi:2-keto-4-pentenoate hydratase/2-oxohepta-3-ene-1,7-dioic acid hydratase in catechol pathway
MTAMRWVRFAQADVARYGILEGDRVQPVDGDPFAGYAVAGRPVAFADVRLLPPVVPPTFYAAGVNYATHLEEARRHGNTTNIPRKPDIGYRAINALIAHDEPIVIPRESDGKVQYEGELVVVIGKRAKHLSEADALGCVLGYTIGNDVSERVWQRGDRTLWRAKNTDTFKPMGPWIATDVDLDAMTTVVRLNGVERTRFRTNDMIFGIATYISAMTRLVTLHPGDIIWMGTDEPTLDMQAGDVVEVEISGIGTLRNPVVAEP